MSYVIQSKKKIRDCEVLEKKSCTLKKKTLKFKNIWNEIDKYEQ